MLLSPSLWLVRGCSIQLIGIYVENFVATDSVQLAVDIYKAELNLNRLAGTAGAPEM
jgi:hypothetical protein